jgi:hypothetical protein
MNPQPALVATTHRLLALQGTDGLWGAFLMTPGESRDWVGALAALALAEAAPRLPGPLADRATAAAEVAAGTLRARIRPPGGWGYNLTAAVDSDSTAAVVRLFTRLGLPIPLETVEFLLRHDRGGGFGTYLPLAHGDAWAAPTVEVGCAVAMALAGAKSWDRQRLIRFWREQIGPAQRPDGTWAAYWWPGPGIPTALALELWETAGHPDPAPHRVTAEAKSTFDALHLALACIATGDAALARRRAEAALGLGAGQGVGHGADAVLLAPPRFQIVRQGEACIEGAGVMSAVAALRLLTRLPDLAATRLRRPEPRDLAHDLCQLASAAGLSTASAALVGDAARPLLAGAMGAGLSWPNRPVSSLAIGWPLEVSARLGPEAQHGFRFSCEAGDVRLPPGLRFRSGLRAIGSAAKGLGLEPAWVILRQALLPLAALADAANPSTRFLLWSGLDVAETAAGLRSVLKVYVNLGIVSERGARLPLATDILRRLGPDGTNGLAAFAASLGPEAFPQQIGLAATTDSQMQAKLYWELPAYDAEATAQAAKMLGLPEGRLDPMIPGLVSRADAARHVSGLAVRIDPETGLRPELTLATQAAQGVRWRPQYEADRIADWSASLGLQTGTLDPLRTALSVRGAAPRSLHTLTLDRRGLTAAVYLRPEGWIRTCLSRDSSELCPAYRSLSMSQILKAS